MKRYRTTFFLLISPLFCACVVSSCQFFKGKEDAPSLGEENSVRKPAVKGIGKVVSLNEQEEFVLIDVSRPKLTSKANYFYIEKRSREAVLNPTGEKIGSYYAADIVSGKVQLGDDVLVKLPKPPAPPEPEVAKVPETDKIVEEGDKLTEEADPINTPPVNNTVKPTPPKEELQPEATIKGTDIKNAVKPSLQPSPQPEAIKVPLNNPQVKPAQVAPEATPN